MTLFQFNRMKRLRRMMHDFGFSLMCSRRRNERLHGKEMYDASLIVESWIAQNRKRLRK